MVEKNIIKNKWEEKLDKYMNEKLKVLIEI